MNRSMNIVMKVSIITGAILLGLSFGAELRNVSASASENAGTWSQIETETVGDSKL